MRRLPGGLIGGIAVLALWSLAALIPHGQAVLVPPPWSVLAQLVQDGWSFYGPNVWPTLGEAMRGFLWGNGLAIGCGLLVLLVPPLQRVVVQLAAVSYCIPVIAIGPLLTVVFSGRTPMVALSALSVFFITLTGLLLGLRAADPTSLDLVRAFGGGGWQRFRRVQLFACLPALFAALCIAAPSALLGAILGEWLGSIETGLGVAMVISMQQMDAARSWGIALVCGGLAGLGYAALAAAGRLATPWRAAGAVAPARPLGSLRALSTETVATALLTLGLVLLAWILFLHVFAVSPLMGKSPAAVLRYLFAGPAAVRHRSGLLAALGITLLHAGSGFLLGLVLGLAAAMLFVLRPAVERSLMPVAMILRSVPLVAMTPLIVLVFGRGLAAVAVIGAIIVFFPTVVNVALGLRSVPALCVDLVRVHGGGDWTVLRKVGVPTALPALFASVRLSLPAALVGALLAEWLATGDGLGSRMQRDITTFQSADLWSAVVLVTLCSLALYALVGLLEASIVDR